VGVPKDEMSPSELIAYQNRLQGRLGEVLSMRTFAKQGQDASDLNSVMMNMPGYDVKSGDDWISVKTLGVAEEKPNLASYRHHLDVLSEHSEPAQRGKYEGQGLPQYAANTLTGLSRDRDNMNDLVGGRSAEEMSGILQEHGCLALPDDHLEGLRSYLQGDFREYISKHPERYPIDQTVPREEQDRAIQTITDDYCRRLRPLGFTSQEIRLALNRVVPLRGRG